MFIIVIGTCFNFVENREVMECVNIGEICNSRFSFCRGGSCRFPNTTDEGFDSRVCLESKKFNEPCIEDQDCELGLLCVKNITGAENDARICQESKFATFGEECHYNIDCVGSLKCINSICTNDTIECNENHDCTSEYYCNGGNCDLINWSIQRSESNSEIPNNCSDARCVPVLDKGGYCLYDHDCKLGLICGDDRLCIEKYGSQFGEYCRDTDQCDISKALVCQDLQCVKRNESITNDCKKDKCEFDDEICDVDTGKCVNYNQIFSEKCIMAERNRDLCLIKNKCSFVNGEDFPNLSRRSCQTKYCSNEIFEYSNQCKIRHLKNYMCNN